MIAWPVNTFTSHTSCCWPRQSKMQTLLYNLCFTGIAFRSHHHEVKHGELNQHTRSPPVPFVKCNLKTKGDLRCFEGFKCPSKRDKTAVLQHTCWVNETENQSRGLDRYSPEAHRLRVFTLHQGSIGQWRSLRR